MERNREGRRASIVGSNGFNRRRHRTNSLRDSPDEDGGVELQESVRLRDRVKKDRDRDRDRERERERDLRERERDLRERSSRSKRRRAERLVNNRENLGGDDTSEESVDEDDDEYEEIAAVSATTTAGRLLQPVVGSISNHHHHHHNSHSSSLGQQPNSNSTNFSGSNHHLQHRKSFPPGPPSSSSSSKVFRAAPIWKPGDEIISVSVPRKARSASTKRSHDWISSSSHINGGGGAAGGEQILRQESSSPVRQGLVSTATPSPAAPMSPSSSNALFKKKLKHSVNNGGLKLKPPKSSSKQHSSSNPEELEIEIAEVLYGLMTQSQGPPKKEDSREADRSSGDAPISNSPSANNQILGPDSTPLHSVAPKRKKPRQVPENSSYGPRSSPISAKLEMDQTAKSDTSSPKLVKISGSTAENGFQSEGYSVTSQGQLVQPPEPTAPDSMKMDSEFKPVAEEFRGSMNLVAKEDVISPSQKESPIVRYEDSISMDSTLIATASVAATMIKSDSTVSDVETQREQKFEIDLMAPPQQTRSSPERETKNRSRTAAVDQKPVVPTVDAELKLVVSKDTEDEKEKSAKEHSATVAAEERKGEKTAESKKEIDLQFDLGKAQRNVDAVVNGAANKLEQQTKKEQQEVPLKANKEEPLDEKSCQPKSSLPFPVPMASWPGGLPPIGYMAAPFQGVVSMDGSSIAPAPVQPLFSQPRPKRCATHCYIARNIHSLQQIVKINPFWQAAAGSASSFFGPKPSNLNVTSSDSHKDVAVRGPNNVQDKGHTVSNHAVKDKVSQADVISDSAKRNQQILIQQALPTVAPSNLMGPTFIFPMNQQQATMAAASARLSGSSNPACSVGASASAAATAMSFNYPAMAANEAQYMAILQNNGYPFPIPPLAAPPNYRGTPATAQAAMPLFNGSFYSSQMIHPSQHLHPQQNASASSGSSSQKQLSSQQQRPQGSGINGVPHNQKSQQPQQLQHPNNQLVPPSRSRHSESEVGCEDSTQPTTSDSRGARPSMNIYGQNFVMPMMNPQNFALMNPQAAFANAAASSPGNGSGSNPSEKKSQQQSFAMSFGPMNSAGTGPAMDISSMAQNHAILQSFSEATRQNIQTMFATAAAAAQVAQKNSLRISEDDNKSADAERKSSAAPKAQSGGGGGQSIAFTRSDFGDSPVSSVQTNSVMESSGRSLNGTSGASRSSRPVTPNAPNVHIQSQLQQQQQQQNAVSRSKAAQISEHLNSSSILHKMMGSGPSISPQWKNSTRAPPTSQASSTTTTLKNHSRTPAQTHTQISFGGNQKPATTSSHGGQAPPPCSNQSPSPSMIGSSTAPSVSKGASANPRTSSGSTNTKIGHQSPSLSKNLPSIPNQKSPSILGNPSMQQQQQQQLPKNMQQAQLFFSSPYSQAQSPHSTPMSSHSSVPSGFYMQRRRQDQQHQQPATLANASTNDPAKAIAAATSNVKGGVLSSQGTIQAAQFATQSAGTTALLPNGFTYAHPVPAAVQVKPAEQKLPAGNDNLHPWQQPEKK